jgi:hypothetical protein
MHRYGRHGPRAWIRWHERHRHRSTSKVVDKPFVPAENVIVIHVSVPIHAGRIIFIVGEETGQTNNQEVQVFPAGDQTRAVVSNVVPSSLQRVEGTSVASDGASSALARRAQIQAVNDLKEIGRMSRDGLFVSVNFEKAMDRAEDFASEDINKSFPWDNPPSPDQYRLLVSEYKSAYEKEFRAGEKSGDESVVYLHTPREVRIREIAIQDRKNSPSNRDYHIRDLAVIRVMVELGIFLGDAPDPNNLRNIHRWADKYETFYTDPREGVNWPSTTFRS